MSSKDLPQDLPLPVVQVLRRAHNAKSSEQFHLNSYFLFEVILKLATAAHIGVYFREQRPSPAVNLELMNLQLPSTGHWLRILRETSRFFRQQQAPGTERAVNASQQLVAPRPGLDACLEWMARASHASQAEEKVSQEFSIIRLFEIFVTYRNSVIGHGAARPSAYYAHMAAPMLRALEELLDIGSSFLFHGLPLAHVQPGADGPVWSDLTGWMRNPLGFKVNPHQPVRAGELYLVGRSELVPLHPLVVYQEDDAEREHIGFLNKMVYRDDVSRDPVRRLLYLDYATGEPLEEHDAREAVGRMMARIQRAGPPLDSGSPPSSSTDDDEREAIADKPAGRIGEFNLLAEIGRGSVGIVYRARQRTTGRIVALKVLRNLSETTEMRFQREIRVLGKVDHKNVVKVLTAGADGKRHYMAMELVEGSDLGSAYDVLSSWGAGSSTDLRGGHLTAAISTRTDREPWDDDEGTVLASPVPLPRAVPVQKSPLPIVEGGHDYFVVLAGLIADAAEGLDVLHKNHVVHRDVKPGNIMVTSNAQRAVIMDLGLAAEVDAMTLAATMTVSRLLGTLRYMSPEQMAGGSNVDHRTDIYSLGATLYELCCFRPMYPARNETELIQKRATEDAPSPLKVNPRIPRALARIIEKAIARSPNNRYQTAEDMAIQLRRFARGERRAVAGLSPSAHVTGYLRRNRTSIAMLASAAVFAVIVGLYIWQDLRLRRVEEARARQEQRTKEANQEIRRAEQEANQRIEEVQRRAAETEEENERLKKAAADTGRLQRFKTSARPAPAVRTPSPSADAKPTAYDFDITAVEKQLRDERASLGSWRAGNVSSRAEFDLNIAKSEVPVGKTVLTRFLYLSTYADYANKQSPRDDALVLSVANEAVDLATSQRPALSKANDAYALGNVGNDLFRLAGLFRDIRETGQATNALAQATLSSEAQVAVLRRTLSEAANARAKADAEERLSKALNSLCFHRVAMGLGREAQTACAEGLAIHQTPVTESNLGHALLLQGKGDEAKAIYLRLVGSQVTAISGLQGTYGSFEDGLLGDFADLRRLSVFRPEHEPTERAVKSAISEFRALQATIKDPLRARLEYLKKRIGWEQTTGVARDWWEAFEKTNSSNIAAVNLLCEELDKRVATIPEFFRAYVDSNVDSVEANLKYLDKMREEKRKQP